MVESAPNFTGFIVRRQRIMGLWFGLLILVFGVIIGAGGTFLHFKDRLIQDRGRGGPNPKEILQGMQAKFSLTEEQVKQIEELFHQRGQTWGEFQKQEQKAMFDGMKSILTAEQYNAWLEEMKQRRERWEREQRERASHGQQGPGRGGPEGQRGQGGPDRGEGRRDRPGQGDRPQQGPPPGEPKPGGPMPGQPTPPPPGAPMPDVAPKPSEPAAPPAAPTTPPTTPEEPKPL